MFSIVCSIINLFLKFLTYFSCILAFVLFLISRNYTKKITRKRTYADAKAFVTIKPSLTTCIKISPLSCFLLLKHENKIVEDLDLTSMVSYD